MALVITLDAPRQGLLPEVEEAWRGEAKAWPSRNHQEQLTGKINQFQERVTHRCGHQQ